MHILCLKVSALSKINQSREVTVAPVTLLRIDTAEDTAIVCSLQEHHFLVTDLQSSTRFASSLKRSVGLYCSRS